MYICENNSDNVICPSGTIIHIDDAFYGRTDTIHCYSPGQMKTTSCTTGRILIMQQCDFKPSCSLLASNAVYDDPCVGTVKYIFVSYTCSKYSQFDIPFPGHIILYIQNYMVDLFDFFYVQIFLDNDTIFKLLDNCRFHSVQAKFNGHCMERASRYLEDLNGLTMQHSV